jgi:hypothetical protein
MIICRAIIGVCHVSLCLRHATHLLIKTITKLGDPAGNLVEVDRLFLAVTFQNIHGHGEDCIVRGRMKRSRVMVMVRVCSCTSAKFMRAEKKIWRQETKYLCWLGVASSAVVLIIRPFCVEIGDQSRTRIFSSGGGSRFGAENFIPTGRTALRAKTNLGGHLHPGTKASSQTEGPSDSQWKNCSWRMTRSSLVGW